MKHPMRTAEARLLPLVTAAFIIVMTHPAHSAPLVIVKQTADAQQRIFSASGQDLPEIKKITFICTYTLPSTTLLKTIVSSPVPATAISASVDSATSTLLIAIIAATTIHPGSDSTLLRVKIPTAATGSSEGDIAFEKAIMIKSDNDSVEIPLQTTAAAPHYRSSQQPIRPALFTGRPLRSVYMIDGRILGTLPQQRTSGCSITITGTERKCGISVR